MSRKKSLTIFILVGVLIVTAAVFSLVEFPIGVNDYKGFAKAVKSGLDLSGGVVVVFDVDTLDDNGDKIDAETLKEGVESTARSMQTLLASNGFDDALVAYDTSTSEPSILVEVPNASDAENIIDLIGAPATLKFTASGDADTVYLEGKKHLENVYITQSSTSTSTYAIVLEFNKEGQKAFSAATKELTGKSMDIVLNGSTIMSISISEQITDNQVVLQSTNGYTQTEAYELATRIHAGMFSVGISERSTSINGALFGENAVRDMYIALAALFLIAAVFFAVRYRLFGLMAIISLLVFSEAAIIFTAILPWMELSPAGMLGLLVGLAFAVAAHLIVLENIRGQFATGKTIPTSIDLGLKKSLATVLDSYAVVALAIIAIWSIGGVMVSGLAMTLSICVLLGAFTALVVTPKFIKMLMPFNSTDAKAYNLEKEVA